MSSHTTVPLTSFDFKYEDGRLTVTLDGSPVDMHLLQRVEIIIDAQLQQPFVRLTTLAGNTGVKLGNSVLEIKQGDPSKTTFEKPPRGPAYHGYGISSTEGPLDANEYDPSHGVGRLGADDPTT